MTASDEQTGNFFLIGGGGHARVLLDAMHLLGMRNISLVDPDYKAGSPLFGLSFERIFHSDEEVLGMSKGTSKFVLGIGSQPFDGGVRERVGSKLSAAGMQFTILIHPRAVVAGSCKLGVGVQILAGVVVEAEAQIDDFVIINTGSTINHHCRIGKYAHVAPGVTICGQVSIGRNVHVGAGATIINGVSVGDDAVIGAGSLVTKNVPAGYITLPGRGPMMPIADFCSNKTGKNS